MAAWCGSLAMMGCRSTSIVCQGTRQNSTSSRSPRAPAPWRGSGRRPRAGVRRTVGHGRRGRLSVARRGLLGPTADAAHAAQVQRLETSRSAAVDSAEAERRRIERDLHDGAQQRLVALAPDSARPGEVRRRSRRRAPAPRRCARGSEVGAQRDPRPRAGHPSGDPRGPWARRRAVRRRRPLAGAGDARRAGRLPALCGRRERRLLRGQRGAHQRRQARQRHTRQRVDRPGWRATRRRGPRQRPGRRRPGCRVPGYKDSATASPASVARCT